MLKYGVSWHLFVNTSIPLFRHVQMFFVELGAESWKIVDRCDKLSVILFLKAEKYGDVKM